MSIDERFNQDEQLLLASMPFAVGSAMAFAGSSGLGTIKEMFANTKSFLEGAKTYPDNEIITALLPNIKDDDHGKEKAKAFQSAYRERIKSKGIDSLEKMKNLVFDDARTVLALLDKKASPKEKEEYIEWTLSIARSVANAAKEGGFLGFGGERFSANEKELFSHLAQALGSDQRL